MNRPNGTDQPWTREDRRSMARALAVVGIVASYAGWATVGIAVLITVLNVAVAALAGRMDDAPDAPSFIGYLAGALIASGLMLRRRARDLVEEQP